jgi:hypothetical protein
MTKYIDTFEDLKYHDFILIEIQSLKEVKVWAQFEYANWFEQNMR